MSAEGVPQEVLGGVDGCRAGWLLVEAAAREPSGLRLLSIDVLPSFKDVLAAAWRCCALAVDMPIGLSQGTPRRADLLARRLLGRPRASSVFPAPARALLAAADYAEACALSRLATGSAISRQAFNILPRIAEVDAVLRPADQSRVVEAHPEVTFRALNAGTALPANKKTPAGREQRRRLLAELFGEDPAAWRVPAGAARDDLYDAAALTWTALRLALGSALRLPADPEVDARGLRMEIVY